jgi:ribose transport system permease protein/putative xylitol transport system permease protein
MVLALSAIQRGDRRRAAGYLLGTLLLGVVANALNLFSVSPFWQPAITGLVILVAVGLDSYQRKRAGSS